MSTSNLICPQCNAACEHLSALVDHFYSFHRSKIDLLPSLTAMIQNYDVETGKCELCSTLINPQHTHLSLTIQVRIKLHQVVEHSDKLMELGYDLSTLADPSASPIPAGNHTSNLCKLGIYHLGQSP